MPSWPEVKADWSNGDAMSAATFNVYAERINALTALLANIPINFSAPVAMTGVTGTDRAYFARTLYEARMRVASAPIGSDLVAEVQHWDGASWTTISTLTVDDGSVLEASDTFSVAQGIGDLLRLNVISVGSSTAATGVTVDVMAS